MKETEKTAADRLEAADLAAILASRRAAELAVNAAKLPTALARAAAAEAKVLHLETVAKYGLGAKDKLNLDTGEITRASTDAARALEASA